MSIVPLNCAPSTIAIRPALRLPSTVDDGPSSIRSLAEIAPRTSPRTSTRAARTSASTRAGVSMVTVPSRADTNPWTVPSIVRSSSQDTSPLMTR